MATELFNFRSYMLNIATSLKDIGHTEAKPKFFRGRNARTVDEMLGKDPYAGTSSCLNILDRRDGKYVHTPNSLADQQVYTFMVTSNVHDITDDDEYDTVIDESMLVCKKIIAKIIKDADADGQLPHASGTGLRDLDKNSISYQTIGPLGRSHYGTMVTFSLVQYPKVMQQYDESDWT